LPSSPHAPHPDSFPTRRSSDLPSEHAAAAWSVAGVIAHEYPGPLTKFLAYGLASAVSYSRVCSRQHFPSDALIGSVLGDLVAQRDRKSTRLNSSHQIISYAVFC